jgi:hypothetical protein
VAGLRRGDINPRRAARPMPSFWADPNCLYERDRGWGWREQNMRLTRVRRTHLMEGRPRCRPHWHGGFLKRRSYRRAQRKQSVPLTVLRRSSRICCRCVPEISSLLSPRPPVNPGSERSILYLLPCNRGVALFVHPVSSRSTYRRPQATSRNSFAYFAVFLPRRAMRWRTAWA